VLARHTGAAHARGEILLFGDDDAVFDKNWISAVVKVFNDHPDVGAVGTKISIRWDREPEDWVRKHEKFLGKIDYGDQLVIQPGLFINGGSFAIKKKILYQVRGFNPGQRGGFLVGDSETGLCRKLAEEGVPVAWTPTTTMWHLQRADINGTLGDLKRRFRNNGISDAYYASFYGWRRRQLLADIVLKSRSLLSKLRDLFVQRADANSRRNLLLGLWHYRYYMAYLWLYRFNSKVRAEVQKVDWMFSANYECPPTMFASQHRHFCEANHSACDSNRLT
jgi:GT2 family glycosyltransferase